MNLKENTERFFVRLPPDAKLWLVKQSRKNASSQNSEIVRCIRERMDREANASTRATTGRVALETSPVVNQNAVSLEERHPHHPG